MTKISDNKFISLKNKFFQYICISMMIDSIYK